MRNNRKKTVAMHTRLGRVESSNHSSCKCDSTGWKQMWEDHRKELREYPLSKTRP